MDKTEGYREHLVTLACAFAGSNRGVDDYAAIEIAKLLDEYGDGKYIPSWAIEDMRHMDGALQERLLRESRKYEAYVEAHKTLEQRTAEQEERDRARRHAIYQYLSEEMHNQLMHKLAGKKCFPYAATLKALRQQELLDDKNELTPLGRRIAEGVVKSHKTAYEKILASTG